ncbi:MAG TPA: hypothetical protein VD764_08580 [Nocardioides sp.]|nr:hypothetical protein [Nocardioides sp.]
MDAVDILKVCFRRWYVMLPILVGAAGISYQLIQTQETGYTAAASYGLVQPRLAAGTDTGERNPLGDDDSDLVGAALEAQLNSRQTQLELGSDATQGWGPGETANGSSYSVKIPLYETTYEVRAWGTDPQAVQDVVDRVLEAAPGIADELQTRAGASAAVRYEPFVLAPTQVDALPSTSAMKLVIAVMGVGVLVGAAWSIVADRLLRRQRPARRPASRTVDPAAGPTSTGTFADGGAVRSPRAPGSPSSGRDGPTAPSSDPVVPTRTTETAESAGATKPSAAVDPGKPSKNGKPGKPGKPGRTGGQPPAASSGPDRRHQPLIRR